MAQSNLLFLYTDGQRIDTLAAYGNTKIEMPNLNRLSEESIKRSFSSSTSTSWSRK